MRLLEWIKYKLTEWGALKQKIPTQYSYSTRRFSSLSEAEITSCSELFSNHYGIYNDDDAKGRSGQRIRMSPGLYIKTYANYPNTYISMCRAENKDIVGFTIFITGEIEEGYRFCWVTQLVVHQDHRLLGIGATLLESAWCFSDYSIRGLATANAITLRILENVTWRIVDKEEVKRRERVVRKILNAVPYLEGKSLSVDDICCQVNSEFYPQPEKIKTKIQKRYEKMMGCIKSGYEWLGIIFNDQPVSYSLKHFVDYVSYSEEAVFDAYSRMQPGTQDWNKGAREEVATLLKMLTPKSKQIQILDIGCGIGRHCIEFANQGYYNILGIDKLVNKIEYAQQSAKVARLPISFIQGDVREYKGVKERYDVVLCLYDVIGTFRDEYENYKILLNIRWHLKMEGIVVISVMNMTLTEKIVATNKCSIARNPQRLLDLPPTRAMQLSGNVFHENMIINTDDGLVYHKEQFKDDYGLDAEYVIADKRYTMKEFEGILNAFGFDVIEKRYVKAGAWHNALKEDDKDAKEILFIAKKRKMFLEW